MTSTFVSSYGPGAASTRTRLHAWIERLGIASHVCDYLGTPRLDAKTLATHAPQIPQAERSLRRLRRRPLPHLCLHRQASPFGFGHLEKSLLRSAEHSVFDFDDALYADRPSSPLRQAVASPARKCVEAAQAARVVIAGSETLADWASNHARDVRVIPTCIEPADYPEKADYALSDPPIIGWLGSPSTEAYLHTIADALLEVHRKVGARLHLVSGGQTNLGRLAPMVDRVDWSLHSFAQEMVKVDVAISPLTDTAWARGKCAYKMLQYGAMSIPAVVTPVGANSQAATLLGMTTASSGHSWTDALFAILEMSAARRHEMATASRPAVEKHYSYARWQSEWMAAQGLAG